MILHNINTSWEPMLEQCSKILTPQNALWLMEATGDEALYDLLEQLVVSSFGPNHPYKHSLVAFLASLFAFRTVDLHILTESLKEEMDKEN